MKRSYLLVAVAMSMAVLAVEQTTLGQTSPAPGASTAAAVKILAPQPGAKLTQDFIHVEYELVNPGAVPSTPTFSLQLDNQPAVQTTATSREFTGLTAGIHNVSVWVVDANGTPVAGSQTAVQFILLNPVPAQTNDQHAGMGGSTGVSGSPNLPSGSTPLPLLSVIGLGVLCGGLITAMRTRHGNSR